MSIVAAPTGSYGTDPNSGNTSSKVVFYFEVGGNAAAPVTITRGQVVAFETTGTGKVVAATGTGSPVVGVAVETAVLAQANTVNYTGPRTIGVCVLGVCEALCTGVNIVTGTALYSDASGRVVTGAATANFHTIGWMIDNNTQAAQGANTLTTIYVTTEKQNP